MGFTEDATRALWHAQSLQPLEANELDLVRAYRELDPSGCAVAGDQLNESCSFVIGNKCPAQNGTGNARGRSRTSRGVGTPAPGRRLTWLP